jgi:hypothetical protein
MSTLLYSHLTSQRESARPGTSFTAAPEAADGSPPQPADGKPGVGGYVDALAALIPAEVLAVHGILIGLGTKVTHPKGAEPVTTITEPTTLKWLFAALLVASLLLYVLPHLSKWDAWDFARMLIPPIAFFAWTALQKATMFDAVAPDWTTLTRTGAGLIVAIVVGSAAFALAYKADQKTD